MTVSEDWFDEYLATNGYTSTPEPDLGVATRPDRLIERIDVEAICEVKEFTTDAIQRRWPGAARTSAGSARGSGCCTFCGRSVPPLSSRSRSRGGLRPLVIVLANPRGVRVDLTGDKLIEAMYGDRFCGYRFEEAVS